MELSPLAKEKLAKLGELTAEEKARLKYAGQLNALLADYFTNRLAPEELWKELKKLKEEGQSVIITEAQLKLLETVNLSQNAGDFERRRKAILAAETLKENADYLFLEQELKSIEELRQQYREEMEKTFNSLKSRVEEQVKRALQQLARQAAARGAAIDIEGSVEATTRATPEWKNFITRHETACNQKLKEYLNRIQKKLQGRTP